MLRVVVTSWVVGLSVGEFSLCTQLLFLFKLLLRSRELG